VAPTAATSPSHRLNRNAATKPAVSRNRAYQRSENPDGGNVFASVGLNETNTMIRIGASRKAKTSASLASPSKNSWSKGSTGRGCTRAARISTSTGLRAPPPEITSSLSGPAGVQRSMPRATVSTVSAVAEATASLSEPPACWTSEIRRSANSSPNRSRPVLFGGRWSK